MLVIGVDGALDGVPLNMAFEIGADGLVLGLKIGLEEGTSVVGITLG